MRTFNLFGLFLLASITVQAQSSSDLSSDLPTGYTIKAKIELPVGQVFETGAVLCAPQTPDQKYNYGYTFKTTGETLELIEFQVDQQTDGPEAIIALRESEPNHHGSSLRIKTELTKITDKAINFSAESLVIGADGNSFGLVPVATVAGILALDEMILNIHVVGTFAQDVEMKCARIK